MEVIVNSIHIDIRIEINTQSTTKNTVLDDYVYIYCQYHRIRRRRSLKRYFDYTHTVLRSQQQLHIK